MGRARVKFSDSLSTLTSQILFQQIKQVNKLIKKKGPKIEAYAKKSIESALTYSPTINSLLAGKLKIDFGLTPGFAATAASDIINDVVAGVRIIYNPSKKDPKRIGSFTLVLSPNPDFYKSIGAGSYISESYSGSQEASHIIDWLEWLMTRGTKVIIGDYGVEYLSGAGRSGGGHMVKDYGDGFRVDPQHAGTIDNNFITRAIGDIIPDLQDFIVRELST